MTNYAKDFGNLPERTVEFTYNGETFQCFGSIGTGPAIRFNEQCTEDASQPGQVAVPLGAAVEYIRACLNPDEFDRFDKALEFIPPPMIHEIRSYLAEVYAGVGPTTEPSGSPPGPSDSASTSTDGSGSPASTPTPSP